uniref:Secreted protein n=1 Tax=Pyxicephalus adspersus TaxID=30357 RepID=A0AAV3AL26_PYXAD|nr:TPA: hypothetical protein GDO54_011385 [Pyxicephalus adspersus]
MRMSTRMKNWFSTVPEFVLMASVSALRYSCSMISSIFFVKASCCSLRVCPVFSVCLPPAGKIPQKRIRIRTDSTGDMLQDSGLSESN